jgi:hypothetical protein
VKHGVPFHLAEALDPLDRAAWSIVFGEFEGGRFDYHRLRWHAAEPGSAA